MAPGKLSRTSCCYRLPGVWLLMVLSPMAHAADSLLLEDPGARSLGRGGASRADPDAVAEVADSVTAASLQSTYAMYAGVSVMPDARFGWRVGALDARTSPIALGVRYQRYGDEPTLQGSERPGWKLTGEELTDPTVHQAIALAAAVPMAGRRFSLGVSGRHHWREGERSGRDRATNLGVSATGMPAQMLVLSLGARNLVLQDYPETQRHLDAGARFLGGETFAVEIDGAVPWVDGVDFGGARWMGGVDVQPISWLKLRAGTSQQEQAWWVHAGLTIGNEKGGLEYGLRVDTRQASDNWHAIDLSLRF